MLPSNLAIRWLNLTQRFGDQTVELRGMLLARTGERVAVSKLQCLVWLVWLVALSGCGGHSTSTRDGVAGTSNDTGAPTGAGAASHEAGGTGPVLNGIGNSGPDEPMDGGAPGSQAVGGSSEVTSAHRGSVDVVQDYGPPNEAAELRFTASFIEATACTGTGATAFDCVWQAQPNDCGGVTYYGSAYQRFEPVGLPFLALFESSESKSAGAVQIAGPQPPRFSFPATTGARPWASCFRRAMSCMSSPQAPTCRRSSPTS